MSTEEEKSTCTYCHSVGPVTDDHVPPKALFGPQDPAAPDLVTVPACNGCREGTSKDDEYMRNMLIFRANPSESSDAEAVLRKTVRGLQRPEQTAFRRAIMGSIDLRPVETPSGVYLGRRPVYPVELPRVERVLGRTVRGLYYHHTENRLPADSVVQVWPEDAFQGLDPTGRQALKGILGPLSSQPRHVLGDQAFVYKYAVISNDPDWGSAWLMRFYKDVLFLAITLPPNYSGQTVAE